MLGSLYRGFTSVETRISPGRSGKAPWQYFGGSRCVMAALLVGYPYVAAEKTRCARDTPFKRSPGMRLTTTARAALARCDLPAW